MPSISMTATWVHSIKIEKGREVFHDLKLSGLGLRVSFTGRKTWQVLYRTKGDSTRRRIDIGEYPVISLSDAREKAHEILLRASKGEDPAGKKRIDKASITFEVLALDYLERHAKVFKRSWIDDERRIKGKLIPVWGKRKALDIKRRDVIEFLDDLAAQGIPIEANRVLALVRKIYNWSIEKDILEYNPCIQVKTVAPENHRDRVLSENEIKAVWLALEPESALKSAIFKLRLLTAQRGGEVASMRWQDIDLDTGWWTIPAEVAKNGLSHRVPLSPQALAILEPLRGVLDGNPWVFPSKGHKGHIVSVQDSLERIRKRSGVEFIAHDLRRTAASWMASMGTPRLVISKILNHVEGGVTMIYDRHSYDQEKAQALAAWAERLMGMVL